VWGYETIQNGLCFFLNSFFISKWRTFEKIKNLVKKIEQSMKVGVEKNFSKYNYYKRARQGPAT
jgi:hypothetical protein